jgi:hypothetical protein
MPISRTSTAPRRYEIRTDLERGRETLCVRARGMIGRFNPSDSSTIIRYCRIETINRLCWVGAPGVLTSHGYGHSGVVVIHADGPAGDRKPSARGKGSPDAWRLRKAGEVLVEGAGPGGFANGGRGIAILRGSPRRPVLPVGGGIYHVRRLCPGTGVVLFRAVWKPEDEALHRKPVRGADALRAAWRSRPVPS